jgi:hypothetical protein
MTMFDEKLVVAAITASGEAVVQFEFEIVIF